MKSRDAYRKTNLQDSLALFCSSLVGIRCVLQKHNLFRLALISGKERNLNLWVVELWYISQYCAYDVIQSQTPWSLEQEMKMWYCVCLVLCLPFRINSRRTRLLPLMCIPKLKYASMASTGTKCYYERVQAEAAKHNNFSCFLTFCCYC